MFLCHQLSCCSGVNTQTGLEDLAGSEEPVHPRCVKAGGGRAGGLGSSPGHAAVVTNPAVLLLVVAAAGLAGVHATVQTLTFVVDQEPEGLQAADAEGVGRAVLGAQQLPLGALLQDPALQLPGNRTA